MSLLNIKVPTCEDSLSAIESICWGATVLPVRLGAHHPPSLAGYSYSGRPSDYRFSLLGCTVLKCQ